MIRSTRSTRNLDSQFSFDAFCMKYLKEIVVLLVIVSILFVSSFLKHSADQSEMIPEISDEDIEELNSIKTEEETGSIE